MSDAKTPTFVYKPLPLTKRLHAKTYKAIDPSLSQLSQVGKTVFITGGSAGIGYSIAQSFGLAGAENVIITGRTQEKLDAAVLGLSQDQEAGQTKFEGVVCEMTNPKSIDHMFHNLAAKGVHVDVLVLNAALNVAGTLSEQGWEKTWEQFIVNTRSLHQLCDRVHEQGTKEERKHYIVNVSTGAIHDFGSPRDLSSYSLTKASGTLLLQKLADEKDSSRSQIISFHPGAVFTDQVREKGLTETSMNWDDASLPGAFAVWCASPEASFLHGRFVWAAWDVDELKTGVLRERIEKDGNFLRIGVHGL
ncbi:hypothetical protein F53441_6420 [Fusarium austroafricanum]|uniref:Peroxisomal short-chain alcohol dehydrogenase n=1 Tax=Fusarium austroafricanum TaxID=2364996 RepID=A0A8H4NZJ1_9HYPO|nr:hypothetical protein F53441_6420 [Fusarium austroafricanum]